VGLAGSNIAYASGYAIVTGKYVSGDRDTDFTTDWFYFTVNTNTATAGSVKGGGFPVSIGPATLAHNGRIYLFNINNSNSELY